MKIKFFSTGKITQGILIGKNGVLRFKTDFAKEHGFVVGQKWRVGVDVSENPVKHIYLLNPSEDLPQDGFKLGYQNNSWFLAGKTLIKELGLTPPLKCKIEKFKDGEYEGFKITLPK